MHKSCERLLMPAFPEDKFIAAVKSVVKANADYVPPYGTGGTLYLRPLMIGVGGNIGVHPAQEYIFTVFAMPVGAYYKGGVTPTNFTTSYYDRAALMGLASLRSAVTTAGVYFLATKRTRLVTQMLSTLIPQPIRRSKKRVLPTSSVSPRITNL